LARLPVHSFIEHLQLNPQHHFCLVNDGSTDGTQELLREIEAKCSNARVLDLSKNMGKAEAVRQGVKLSLEIIQAEYIGYMDADLATPLSFISVMQTEMKTDPSIDLIFGSRQYAEKNSIERKAFRHYTGRVVSRMINRALGKKFGDTQCGAKLMKSNIAAEVFHEPFQSSWLFDVEIIKKLLTRGNENIKEIPVTQWRDVGNSKVSKWYFFKMFGELRKIRKIKAK
jgi:dolichyl-phosphate beta-glucosyltransferase